MHKPFDIRTLPPLSLYVHVPWCIRKCPYCDFNSHEAKGTLPIEEYVKALVADLSGDAWMSQDRKLHSVFFGGGTPSLLPNEAIAEIITQVDRLVGIEENAEITLEANPGAIEHHDFSALRSSGVNRLSLGVQSFQSRQLENLGRIHSRRDAEYAIKSAQDGGFGNLNIDLMHGLPGQTLGQAHEDLRCALALSPSHISWYQLTIEQNTEFYSQPPSLPTEDLLVDIYLTGQEIIANAAYAQYEVSAYAREGRQSRHNLNYWQFGDYLAIGAGAHGKITLMDEKRITRYRKTRLPKHYLDGNKSFTAADDSIPLANLALEFMMNALRLNQGFSVALFCAHTGLAYESIEHKINTLIERDLLNKNHTHIWPTSHGRQFLNNVLQEFVK